MGQQFDVAVVGAGFGGIGMAARLLQDGHRVTLFERGERVGGGVGGQHLSRRRLRHPLPPVLVLLRAQARLDAAPPPQSEIRDYLRGRPHGWYRRPPAHPARPPRSPPRPVGRRRPAVGAGRLGDGSTLPLRRPGRRLRPAVPARHPAAAWPERLHGRVFRYRAGTTAYPLDGRKVAVVGTGASAIQFVPQIAPRGGAAPLPADAPRGCCRSGTAPSRSSKRDGFPGSPSLRLNRCSPLLADWSPGPSASSAALAERAGVVGRRHLRSRSPTRSCARGWRRTARPAASGSDLGRLLPLPQAAERRRLVTRIRRVLPNGVVPGTARARGGHHHPGHRFPRRRTS